MEAAVARSNLSLLKGHALTEEALLIRKYILNLMCRLGTSWTEEDLPYFVDALIRLQPLEEAGLVDYSRN